jgi:type III secretion protein Q
MTSPPAPLVLPRYTANQAQAGSLIARHGASMRLVVPLSDGADGRPAAWHIGLTPELTPAVLASATQSAVFEWAGARFVLSLPARAAQAWLASRFEGLDLAELPAALQTAALETLLNDATAALGGVSPAGPARIVESFLDRPVTHLLHAWTLTARSEATGEVLVGALSTDALGLMLLAGLVKRAEPAANLLDLDSLPVAVRVKIGETQISTLDLRSLHPRDMVLLDHYFVTADQELWLATAGGQGIRVRQQDSAYLVTKGWTALMTQTPQSTQPADDSAPLDLDAIPVRLEFDLGDRHISLADLRKLQPGEVFALDRPLADGAVHIRANGALIGTGELVEVDGRIGVTIRTLGKVPA